MSEMATLVQVNDAQQALFNQWAEEIDYELDIYDSSMPIQHPCQVFRLGRRRRALERELAGGV